MDLLEKLDALKQSADHAATAAVASASKADAVAASLAAMNRNRKRDRYLLLLLVALTVVSFSAALQARSAAKAAKESSSTNAETLALVNQCVGPDRETDCRKRGRAETQGAVLQIGLGSIFASQCSADGHRDEALVDCVANSSASFKAKHPELFNQPSGGSK